MVSNKEQIIELFYIEHIKPVDIARKFNVSNTYITKVIKKYLRGSYLNKDGYVCVNADGSILKPDYVSHKFNEILKNNNLKHIRFHDLRHSCASLLLSNFFIN